MSWLNHMVFVFYDFIMTVCVGGGGGENSVTRITRLSE